MCSLVFYEALSFTSYHFWPLLGFQEWTFPIILSFFYMTFFIYNDTYWDGTFIEEAARRFGLELSLQRRTRHLETRTHHFSTHTLGYNGAGEAKKHGIVEVA